MQMRNEMEIQKRWAEIWAWAWDALRAHFI